MTVESPKVAAAKARADVARRQFLATAHELQARLTPAAIAEQARDAVRDKGEALADQAGAFARQRPAVVGGAAAAGLLLLARKPLLRLFRRKPRSASAGAKAARAKGDEE